MIPKNATAFHFLQPRLFYFSFKIPVDYPALSRDDIGIPDEKKTARLRLAALQLS